MAWHDELRYVPVPTITHSSSSFTADVDAGKNGGNDVTVVLGEVDTGDTSTSNDDAGKPHRPDDDGNGESQDARASARTPMTTASASASATSSPTPSHDASHQTFTVASFNVLAEAYLTPRSHPGLPPDAARVAFDPARRREVLLRTLRRLTAASGGGSRGGCDVLCLQELDLHEECVGPLMSSLGYDVRHSRVEGRSDRCAIFWRRDVFEEVRTEVVEFDDLAGIGTTSSTTGGVNDGKTGGGGGSSGDDGGDEVDDGDDGKVTATSLSAPIPSGEADDNDQTDLRTPAGAGAEAAEDGDGGDHRGGGGVGYNAEHASVTTGPRRSRPTRKPPPRPPSSSALSGMVSSFLRRNTAVAVILRHRSSAQRVVFASAHLYWNPGYEYVKLCQAKYLVDRLDLLSTGDMGAGGGVADDDGRGRGGGRIPVVLCGDFNSTPGSTVHRFLSGGRVDARRVAPWRPRRGDEEDDDYLRAAENGTCRIRDGTGGGDAEEIGRPSPPSHITETADGSTTRSPSRPPPAPPPPPPPPVRYLLDFTLNRFTRWMRLLGIDAAIETEAEERERTRPQAGGVSVIPLFERCRAEGRTLITTSRTVLRRKDCPAGTYHINPPRDDLEDALCHILLLHGAVLRPRRFLTRCVVCNGSILEVTDEAGRERIFAESGAPNLPDNKVYSCDGCRRSYWWSERPNSSSSRAKDQATRLFRQALRAGVPYDRSEGMGIFDFVDVEAEREVGRKKADSEGATATATPPHPTVEALEWLKRENLANPFDFRSAYAWGAAATCGGGGGGGGATVGEDGVGVEFDMAGGEALPFTNVTRDFAGTLDYIFYEPNGLLVQTGRLDVPTSFATMNVTGVKGGHLIPSAEWPSDHLALGATFAMRQSKRGKDEGRGPVDTSETASSNSVKVQEVPPSVPHRNGCSCGCVPSNIFSLFEMAEKRKQYRALQKAKQGVD